jgi:hypothetical protein
MKLEDLLALDPWPNARAPATDPLLDQWGLTEAQVLSIRLDVVTSTAGILFDNRQGHELPGADVALIIVRETASLSWTPSSSPSGAYTAWAVTEVEARHDKQFDLRIWCVEALLSIRGVSAGFFAGNVPGLPAVPPDYTGSTIDIERGLPRWDSDFDLVFATTWGRVGSSTSAQG